MANPQNPHRLAQRTLPAPVGRISADRAKSAIPDPDRDLLSTVVDFGPVARSTTARDADPAPARPRSSRGVSRLLPFWAGSRRFQVG